MFDLSHRCLFKSYLQHLYNTDMLIAWNLAVYVINDFFDCAFLFFVRRLVTEFLSQDVNVREDLCLDLCFTARMIGYRDNITDLGEFGKACFKLPGIDIFAVLGNNDILSPSSDVERTVGIHSAEVSRTEPSVTEHRLGCFFILILAEHNVIALGKYLSHTLAVRLVYRYLQKWASRG